MRTTSASLALFALLVAACGAGPAAEQAGQVLTAAAMTPAVKLAPSVAELPDPEPVAVLELSVVKPAKRLRAAVGKGPIPVYAHPEAHAPVRTLDPNTILGTPTVVYILEATRERMNVMLPGRPNGATGWVEWNDVDVFDVARSVEVDLEDRMLVVFEDGEVVFETPVGIGSPTSPTPTGHYFVTDAAVLANESGPWGPYAFGLSARSNTVTEFNGGDGIIGIHGTNRPSSIGYAQSLGCIRLENATMEDLFELLSVGTPVSIRR